MRIKDHFRYDLDAGSIESRVLGPFFSFILFFVWVCVYVFWKFYAIIF